jgi:electron transport complex protein RnfB
MTTDVYQRLAQHLDDLPAGYPPTDSGVELRILRVLFTPEEAELAVHLTLLTEEARVIAHRAQIPVKEAAQRLEEMAKKGLVFDVHRENKAPVYMAAQFAVGIWEYQVNKLTPEFIEYFDEYLPVLADTALVVDTPQLRTIPVDESVDAQTEVMAYEQVEALIRQNKTITVAPCICRQEKGIVGEACDKPSETCLSFGIGAEYIQRTAGGRHISQDEALDLLSQANEAGLVLQPGNAKEPMFI